MYRSRPVRRRRSRSGSTSTAPFVAFALICCVGILFAGCTSKVTIKGPTPTESNDVTFTQEDIARFRDLSQSSDAASSVPTLSGTTASGTTVTQASTSSTAPVLATGSSATDLPSTPPVVDLSMKTVYESLRASTSGTGPNTYKVNNSFMNVRQGPNSQAKLITSLNGGDEVTLVEFVNGEWAKIQMKNGTQGYVASRYLARYTTEDKVEAEKKAYENMYYVSFAFVNVRSAADQSGEKLGQIPGKQFVRPIKIENGWAKISFEGKDGYVSMDYLAKFTPVFIVRQNSYSVPVLHFDVSDDSGLETIVKQALNLKQNGVKLLAMKDFYNTVLEQEKRDFVFGGKNAIIAVTGVTPTNVRKVSDALTSNGIRASIFLETKDVGLTGITQKTLLRLLANGFDIESSGHTGDDLRALTSAQVKLEVQQSRKLLEDLTGKTVFAMYYPQGGTNERVMQIASDAGYLFGIEALPDKKFTREQFLRMPSTTVTSSMTSDDLLRLFQ